MIDQTISHYKVLSELGRGGMGVVYRATDTSLDRTVALKFLAPHLVEDQEGRQRFIREAKAAAALDHPNICTVYEINQEQEQTFIAMAYIEGQSVKDKIAERPLKLEEALDIAIQTAQGLQAAHEKGIVHRDIKSANLMVTPQGTVKVMDFGLAQLADQSPLTKTATLLGTPAYTSPEQAQRQPTDARSDIWSLGVVLYEMVGGRLPFESESEHGILYGIVNSTPEPLTALRVGLPIELDRIVGKAMAKNPAERYQHVEDMLVDLRSLKNSIRSGHATTQVRPVPGANRTFRTVVVACVAIAAMVAYWLWVGRGNPESPVVPMATAPLTSYPGYEIHPSFSPDASQIAFSWDGDDLINDDIYVQQVSLGRPIRITTDPAMDLSPAWSPDGRYVAFLRALSGEKEAIFLIPALGGPERRLTEIYDRQFLTSPWIAWSPDSQWVAVPDKDKPEESSGLFLVSIETGEKRRVTSPPRDVRGDSSPAFSPDGRTLAFSRGSSNVSDVYLLPLSKNYAPSGKPRQLTFSGGQRTTSPTWTADGRSIIFSSGRSEWAGLWRIPVSDSSDPQPLVSLGVGLEPTISRDGKRLAYTRRFIDTNIWKLSLDASSGGIGPPAKVISSTRRDYEPEYSPNGEKVAFTSTRSGNMEIWVCESDGDNLLQLTSLRRPVTSSAAWSPDGERIAFNSRSEGKADIFVINAEGGAPERMTTESSSFDVRPSWSRDGNWIYFSSNRTGRNEVWKIPSGGGQAVQVTNHGGGTPVESSDGRWLFYEKNGELWQMPLDGGEARKVFDSVHLLNFTLADTGIYFATIKQRSDGSPSKEGEIYFLSLTDNSTKLIATVGRPYFGLTVAPDNRSILYSQLDQAGSDLMLADNFR